jgi:hypothetical protein
MDNLLLDRVHLPTDGDLNAFILRFIIDILVDNDDKQ